MCRMLMYITFLSTAEIGQTATLVAGGLNPLMVNAEELRRQDGPGGR